MPYALACERMVFLSCVCVKASPQLPSDQNLDLNVVRRRDSSVCPCCLVPKSTGSTDAFGNVLCDHPRRVRVLLCVTVSEAGGGEDFRDVNGEF